MPFMRVGLFLVSPGHEAEAGELVDHVLEHAERAPGYRFGFRVLGRVGHGGRWHGWITSWDELDALQEASAATTAWIDALHVIAEPRTCQELVLEAEAFEPAVRDALKAR